LKLCRQWVFSMRRPGGPSRRKNRSGRPRVFLEKPSGEHPDYANALENLAVVSQERRDFVTAESLMARVLDIRKTVFGPEHHDVATSLDAIAGLKRAEGKPQEAAVLYEQALAMLEKILGPESP